MVVIGCFFASAVFGAADLIVCIHASLFRFQLLQQGFGVQHTVCQQPCCQFHSKGMSVEQVNDLLHDLRLFLRSREEFAHQFQQLILAQFRQFQRNMAFISATGGE